MLMKSSSLLSQSLIVSSILLIIGVSSCYARMQMGDNITIKATLKDGYLQNIIMFADNKNQCSTTTAWENWKEQHLTNST